MARPPRPRCWRCAPSPWSRRRDRITHGRANGWPRRAHRARQRRVHLADLARLAFDLVAQDVRVDARPRAPAPAAASSALLRRGDQVHLVAGEARRRRASAFRTRRSRGRRAPRPARRCRSARGWRSASAQVVGSGTVGPLAMTAGSSPGTSLISSVTTRAGAQRAASRPPLIADRCLRTQFISSIAAPLRSSALVDRLLVLEA